MSGKKAGSVFEINALFEQELQACNEDMRRQAALLMLPKLRRCARVTMAKFHDSLQRHREVWSAVLEMSAVEFASLIAGIPRAEPTKDAPEQTKRIPDLRGYGLNLSGIGRKLTSENLMPTCAKKQKRTLTAIGAEQTLLGYTPKRAGMWHAGPVKAILELGMVGHR